MFRTTIAYLELDGSMVANIGRDDASGVRSVLVEWADKEQFIEDILGGVLIEGESQTYTAPDSYPGYSYLFALTTQCQGLGLRGIDASGIIKYEKAKIVINYGLIRDPSGSGGDSNRDRQVFITESRTTGYEHQQLKSQNFYWLSTPITFYDLLTTGGRIPDNHVRGARRVREHNINPSDINFDDPVGEEVKARIVLPRMEITIDIHWWFNYPDDDFAVCQLLGTVNDNYYRPLLTTYPPQTLLLGAIERNRQYTSRGISAWQLSFKFLLNVHGWNTTYREEKWKETTSIDVLGGKPIKTQEIDYDWPPGFYPIATATNIDHSIPESPIPSDDSEMKYPYQLANFETNLLPHGFRQQDFGVGGELRP